MKTSAFFPLFLFPLLNYAQNYVPLNSSSVKVFTADSTQVFSIAFDSVTVSGIDTHYYNYYNINTVLVPSSCAWWGPTDCWKQDLPSWMGNPVLAGNNIYTFKTLKSDTLVFDFNLAIGDSSTFYHDSLQVFGFIFASVDTATVLGISDSVRTYRIFHADSSGNAINSPLNGHAVLTGKNYGLVSFFRIDSFPQLLQPLYIVGNGSPHGGITALTSEMLYNYEPGDEVQYYNYSFLQLGPPWQNYQIYVRYTFINKTVTADSILYSAARNLFYIDSAWVLNDTITLSYYRYDTIASAPFEAVIPGNGVSQGNSHNALHMSDYCGMKLWTFTMDPIRYRGYCADENCWGYIDTGGPLPDEEYIYVEGLGRYRYTSDGVGPGMVQHGSIIVYFKKNNIACDTPVVQGIHSISSAESFELFPNPANKSITLKAAVTVNHMVLFDVHGKKVNEYPVNSNEIILEIRHLENGLYIARIYSDKGIINKKFIVMKD